MNDASCTVKILEGIEHLCEEEASSILAEALPTRVLDQVEHVEVVAAEELCHDVDVRIITVWDSLDMHDPVIVVS